MYRHELLRYVDRIAERARSTYWRRGVKEYAQELCEELPEEFSPRDVSEKMLLNGAKDWNEYSYGGCSLIYDGDIAFRLCTPSEYGKKRGGELQPSRAETWLDVQARALRQAARMVYKAAGLFLSEAAGW